MVVEVVGDVVGGVMVEEVMVVVGEVKRATTSTTSSSAISSATTSTTSSSAISSSATTSTTSSSAISSATTSTTSSSAISSATTSTTSSSAISSATTKASSSSMKPFSTTSSTITKSNHVLLKGRNGSFVATAQIMHDHGDIIHGHQLPKGCIVVAAEDIIQVGAQLWFSNPFDDNLCKGVIAEWPKNQVIDGDGLSALHTRKRKRCQ